MITKMRLDAITEISQEATQEFNDIVESRSLRDKLVSLDKAILDSHGTVSQVLPEKVGELEKQRGVLDALKKRGREMEEKLKEMEEVLKGNVEEIEGITGGLIKVCGMYC
jgi:replicative DNA helicase